MSDTQGCLTPHGVRHRYGCYVDVELEPEQPEEVARAVAELLVAAEPAADPWWQAGLDDSPAGAEP